ncbi:MAG: metallophosphoesterase [Succinivibrio sp.]
MVYLTSDLHIGHLNIIKYCRKEFEFSEKGRMECEDLILRNYNCVVSDNDIVLIMGDLFFGPAECIDYAKDFFSKLKGRRILLKGNHDQRTLRFYRDELGFEACMGFIAFEDLFFCHYPLDEVKSKYEIFLKEEFDKGKFSTIYHGHIHDKDPVCEDGICRINVSVDYKPNNYSPLQLSRSGFEEYLRSLL